MVWNTPRKIHTTLAEVLQHHLQVESGYQWEIGRRLSTFGEGKNPRWRVARPTAGSRTYFTFLSVPSFSATLLREMALSLKIQCWTKEMSVHRLCRLEYFWNLVSCSLIRCGDVVVEQRSPSNMYTNRNLRDGHDALSFPVPSTLGTMAGLTLKEQGRRKTPRMPRNQPMRDR